MVQFGFTLRFSLALPSFDSLLRVPVGDEDFVGCNQYSMDSILASET